MGSFNIMESNKLSLEEVIELAGKVSSWDGPDKSGYNVGGSDEMYLSPGSHWHNYYSKSYRGMVEDIKIIITHTDHEDHLVQRVRSEKDRQPDVHNHYFKLSATLGKTVLGEYNTPLTDYLSGVEPGCEVVLKTLYHSVKATYKKNQQEEHEMAERYALEEARKLLG